MAEATPVDISALIPCLNEAENVGDIARAIAEEMVKAEVSYEILFIDNGSTDGTIDLVKAMCAGDSRIRLIVNNKNYGQMRSPTYGIYQTTGRAVVGIAADFQDPPALIGDFIRLWRAGALIVLGVRRQESSGGLNRAVRLAGYAVLRRLGDYQIIPGATGFGLYDRVVVDTLKKWRDPEPFFRGLLVESGFGVTTIPYDQPRRERGRTKNTLATLVNFALAGLASSSKKLLRFPLFLSLLVFMAAGLTILAALMAALVGRPLGGWLLGAAVELGFALCFLFLGLIGEQLRLVTEIARGVPLVVERERVNFPNAQT